MTYIANCLIYLVSEFCHAFQADSYTPLSQGEKIPYKSDVFVCRSDMQYYNGKS